MSVNDEEKSIGEESGTRHPQSSGEAEPEVSNAPPSPGPIPNGGLQAWLQVLGAWILFFNTWGVLNEFGVFQTYYESGELFRSTSSNISWIGSIQAFMLLTVGAVAGPFYDRGHFRWLLVIGTFLVVFGHMMLSLCTEYWQCLLAQGFVIGIGAGCLFVPAVAIMPTYFSTKIGLALGIAASGSSTGGIIYPIMFNRLLSQVGFGWAVRILGFTALVLQLIPIFVMKMRVKPGKVRSLIDWTAFTDAPYMMFVFGTILGFIGLYVGLFYLSYFAESTGITDTSLAFYLVAILNAASVFGRTLPNWVSDKTGPLNVVIPGAICVGISLLGLTGVHNAAGIIVIAVLFGFFSGIFVALPPVLFVALTKDKSKIGTRIGMGFAMCSAGALIGGPGGGGVLGTNAANLNWTGLWIFGGVCCIAGGVVYLILRTMLVGPRLKVKA